MHESYFLLSLVFAGAVQLLIWNEKTINKLIYFRQLFNHLEFSI